MNLGKVYAFFLDHKRWFFYGFIGAIVLGGITLGFLPRGGTINTFYESTSLSDDDSFPSLNTVYDIPLYSTQKKEYERLGIPVAGITHRYEVATLNGLSLTASDETYGSFFDETYAEGKLLDPEHNVSWTHTFDDEGLYYLAIDYIELEAGVESTKVGITINDAFPFYEAQTIVLPSRWVFESDEFTLDRYGNELQPTSIKVQRWTTHALNDQQTMHRGLFAFRLEQGDEVSLHYVNARLLIGAVSLVLDAPLATYEAYRSALPNADVTDTMVMTSVRSMSARTDPSIRLRTEQDPSSLYYNTQSLKLNTIFGDSWQSGGQAIEYAIDVPTTGFYFLTFKYRQYLLNQIPTFRNILIDGHIPFQEMEGYAFPYSASFVNRTLSGLDGEPFAFYLTEGSHTLTLQAVNYPYRFAVETIQFIMSQIQDLSLRIKRYTSGGTDLYRDWDIEQYFPEAADDMTDWATLIEAMMERLVTLSPVTAPSALSSLRVSIDRLRDFAADINRLPSLMVQFSDGDSSVNQMLGNVLQMLLRPSLEMERFILHGEQAIPSAETSLFHGAYEGAARLVYSFIDNPYSIQQRDPEALTVWVNHPRTYIEIMQHLIDQQYEGNRKVNLSQMPDENKLILANVSGKSPDVALGVNHWIPYEFASRNAAFDLRSFDGYENAVSHFSPGAFIPYVFEDGVYGLPETQNFQVTFYRKDILASIGVDQIPQTWDDIIAMLPLLQSYGMNYYSPLSMFSGLKPFVATLPFIYQFGGTLYTDDGLQTAINSEATLRGITLMADLFTLYNIPKYVASFFNQFRYGTLPIGIGDLGTYLLLSAAAPELEGLWGMDLHPGVYNSETDEIVRYAASGAQGSMILASTSFPDDSWDFLSWWMSTEIQAQFAFLLSSTYGKTYLWNSANLDAFEQLSMPREYKDIILEQWTYASEASRIPGAYMVEREISNAWTNIVFNGVNPRQAIDEAVRVSNREILYKMEEFGYALNGQAIKPYPVPTIQTIGQWLTQHE